MDKNNINFSLYKQHVLVHAVKIFLRVHTCTSRSAQEIMYQVGVICWAAWQIRNIVIFHHKGQIQRDVIHQHQIYFKQLVCQRKCHEDMFRICTCMHV